MRPNTPRRRSKRRSLHLWPVGTVLALTFATAILVAAAVFFAGWELLGAQGLTPEYRIDSKTLFDLVKLSFGVVAGAGALVALVVAYRRQRVDEDGALREATRLHTERFTTAVSQLGEESAAVRLGGVHALAGLANDAPTRELRQTCIDVLCAYIRLPYTAEADLPQDDADARHAYLSLREVRRTVIRLIRDQLRLPIEDPHSWQGHDLDFTGVTFDGGDFTGSRFSGGSVTFTGATFSRGFSFANAAFSGGTVEFVNSTFSGHIITFVGAVFSGGTVYFSNSVVSGGMLTFHQAVFSGSRVIFTGADFSGGTVNFSHATFSGGIADFAGTTLSGATVRFARANFSNCATSFLAARFSGSTVDFTGAKFSGGRVQFAGATFSGGTVDFADATFSSCMVHFGDEPLSRVAFGDATFSGGTVDFSRTPGESPILLPQGPPPTGLILAQAWDPPTL
ncbi:pentapeptide repeat-containing protein [Streptomyces sp. NPDC056512]|uniref:pentapeptide repeat-containing protein n=1 Tax=Streptomyces sp. NPDC056512 TaxID=3345846 RepID=UPI0036BE6934